MASHLNIFGVNLLLPIVIVAGMCYSIFAKKLTVQAACIGGLLASLIAVSTGFIGFGMMVAFFVLGSAATSYKQRQKAILSGAGEFGTGRKTSQVLANAGVSAFSAGVGFFFPASMDLMLLVMSAAFASATADTLSSELGMVFGQRFYNVITLKSDRCGMDGVISLEGTLIGVLGSATTAVLYSIAFGFDIRFFWIVFAGTFGNLTDSVLGALLERKGLVGNDAVNFLSTLAAGLVVVVLELCC